MTSRGTMPAFLVLAALAGLAASARASSLTDTPSDPCTGPNRLFAELNRPTVADSVCVASPGNLLVEGGYKNQRDREPGYLQQSTYPNATLRYGLPEGWEIDLFPPNYATSTKAVGFDGKRQSFSGFGDAAFGAKYEFGRVGPVYMAVDSIISVPTGASAFTSGASTATVHGIIHFGLTKHIAGSLQLGVSSLAFPLAMGKVERFTEFSPDFVLKYTLDVPVQFYGEFFGTTNPGGAQKVYAFDGGIRFLVAPWWEVDAEAGTLLSRPRGFSGHYVAFGFGARL